jgi:pimeloyl-ACP methyl ester carboxylesterase
MKDPFFFFLLWALVAGCASAPVTDAPALSATYSQLPEPDVTLNIAGLGPCNDGPDRSLHLNSRQPVTILVHGCFGSAGRFRMLSEVLAFHGQQSACFSYNDRDSIMVSSRQLAEAVEELANHLVSPQITVMGHSQGGLVARKALILERDAPIQAQAQLKLVTISAPLSGIRAARICGIPLLRMISLGFNDLACWLISGNKWHEITDASDFIQKPGSLVPSVERYLLVSTDEEGTCRRRNELGRCVEDDFIFTLDEQKLPPVPSGARATVAEVRAGHVEIVGEAGVRPVKLIQILQQEGYLRPTELARSAQFNALLIRLYE